jgi:post-segregation antitoxin (ccd killing protein)
MQFVRQSVMTLKRPTQSTPKKRRTTLTLPADILQEAEGIARARQVNVSTVIAEALSDGLRLQTAAERAEHIIEGYKNAFSGFSDDEMAILDGVILEEDARR